MNGAAPPPIRVLPDSVAASIAAGEVITRPLSVVRELLDNALDAGASRVAVEIAGGGYELITVHDDGWGIGSCDMDLLGQRHATSKLADGRLGSVSTLGFRGEALASIVAVAEVEVRTRRRQEPAGTRLRFRSGQAIERTPIGRQVGTSVEARRLFARHPVRRQAVEPAREQGAIRRLVGQLALARPAVGFSLSIDGREVLRTNGGALEETTALIWGEPAARRLVPFGPHDLDGAIVEGLIGGPSLHRARRDQVVLAVNGRLCDVPEISRAIDRAWADILPRRRFPVAVLQVSVPSEALDINVHPAKEQVALLNGRRIGSALERALREELGRSMHLPSGGANLVLTLEQLPGLRAAERGEPYGSGAGWGGLVVDPGSLPRLRVVGQIDDTLIVCESEIGTLLIDQHRAHERVIYELLASPNAREHDPPVTVRLDLLQRAVARDRADELSDAGWDVRITADVLAEVRACPEWFEPADLPGVLEQASIDDAGSLLAAAACHGAIRKRRPISPEAAVELLEALTATRVPTTCPHGQPIVLRLDRRFLERQFAWR